MKVRIRMGTIYNKFIDMDNEIAVLEDSIKVCGESGYNVEGEHMSLREQAEAVLKESTYSQNITVQRLKSSSLRKIVNNVKSTWEYKFKFPWNKEQRQEYNSMVEQLESIIPSAYLLKRNSIFNIREPEGAIGISTGLSASMGYLVGIGLSYTSPELSDVAIYAVTAFTGCLGFALGCATAISGHETRKSPQVSNEIEYVDSVLGGK